MNKFLREFITKDPVTFQFKVGRQVASGLAGFIAGVLVTLILFAAIAYLRFGF